MKLAVAVLALVLAACAPPAREAAEEGAEPHDQSAFARDPSETHVMSPDEPDMHPAGDTAAASER